MNVLRLDHVHVKVADLAAASDRFDDLLGTQLMRGIDYTETYGMTATFGGFPISLELMQVTDPSPAKEMAKIYDDAPYGLFALSYAVEDIETTIAEMETRGYKLVLRYEFGPVKEALFDTREELATYIEFIQYGTPEEMAAYAASYQSEG